MDCKKVALQTGTIADNLSKGSDTDAEYSSYFEVKNNNEFRFRPKLWCNYMLAKAQWMTDMYEEEEEDCGNNNNNN